jgi:hypothetical protein
MLRRLLGVAGGVGVLSLAPVSFDAAEPGQIPTPTVSDLACSEKAECCIELRSICLAAGEPQIDRREAKGGSCK